MLKNYLKSFIFIFSSVFALLLLLFFFFSEDCAQAVPRRLVVYVFYIALYSGASSFVFISELFTKLNFLSRVSIYLGSLSIFVLILTEVTNFAHLSSLSVWVAVIGTMLLVFAVVFGLTFLLLSNDKKNLEDGLEKYKKELEDE